ncbi:MAG TPA: hypothetical protein VFD48_16120 [Pyrinomonadaceae bacterium]|nr:hypothetical protein [Pyrinomonadaceae bacterium]
MPWRENDNYGYRDGDHQKPDFRGGFEGKSEQNDDSATYGGFSAKLALPFKGFETLAQISMGSIISGTDSATKVCGELSQALEVSAEAAKELLDLKQALSKLVDVLDKIKFGSTNERPIDSLSLEVKLTGEVNLLPLARSLESSLKISTTDGVSADLKSDTTIGDKISVGVSRSIEGCMTIKNRDRNPWDLINKW